MGMKSSHAFFILVFESSGISRVRARVLRRINSLLRTSHSVFNSMHSALRCFFFSFSINKIICFCFTSPSFWRTSKRRNDWIWLTSWVRESIKMNPDNSQHGQMKPMQNWLLVLLLRSTDCVIKNHFMSKSHVISYVLWLSLTHMPWCNSLIKWQKLCISLQSE